MFTGLNYCLSPFPLADVSNHASEISAFIHKELGHSQFHRKCRAVPAKPDDDPPHADDLRFPRSQVIGNEPVMLTVVWFGHQHLHVLADDLRCRVAKQRLGGFVEGLNDAPLVNTDDAIEGRLYDRIKERPIGFSIGQICGHSRIMFGFGCHASLGHPPEEGLSLSRWKSFYPFTFSAIAVNCSRAVCRSSAISWASTSGVGRSSL